jgi:hypothetical protein
MEPKVHYRVHNSSPLVPILSHINLFHVLPSYVFKIYLNNILRLGFPSGLFICFPSKSSMHLLFL